MKIQDNLDFDVVIIGGGTAGSIIANRLSSRKNLTVLLLEAGLDFPNADDIPSELRQGHSPITSKYNWDLRSLRKANSTHVIPPHLESAANIFAVAARRFPQLKIGSSVSNDSQNYLNYPMGKVIGGSSSVNGALAFHGREDDFKDWENLGNDFWSWANVVPEIAKLSTATLSSRGLPLEVPLPADFTMLQRAFLDSCIDLGFSENEGSSCSNGQIRVIAKNTDKGNRVSAAAMYLDTIRTRENLTIWDNCHVDKLLVSPSSAGGAIDGVEFLCNSRRYKVNAGHVVLTAGAVHSPAILLRSGIGSCEDLEKLKIVPVINSPGVGRNLADHPVVSLWGVSDSRFYVPGEAIHQLMLEQNRSISDPCGAQLLMLSAVPTSTFPPLNDLVGSDTASGISVVLPKPRSVGQVELVSNNAFDAPRITVNCLSETSDQVRMMEGVRLAWKILKNKHLRSTSLEVALWTQDIIDSDRLLNNFVQRTVRAAWHPVGTLKMGLDTDKFAVVNQFGMLKGCSNVTVADASVMPVIPSVPTNLTCMLIAERISQSLLDRLH
jgi:choline dehydrogenase